MTYTPSKEAWSYFVEHLGDIRSCVEQFLPMQQWNSMMGPFGSSTEYTLEDFDAAVENRNALKLCDIMDDAWGRAPESTSVYDIPGFTEMCNLLDGTVEGFLEDDDHDDEHCG